MLTKNLEAKYPDGFLKMYTAIHIDHHINDHSFSLLNNCTAF